MRSKLLLLPAAFALALTAVGSFVANAWAAPKYKVLHGFTGGSDGGGVWGTLALDDTDNLHGTTVETVFEVTPHSDSRWSLKILHRFSTKDGEGNGGLVLDAIGNVYGGTPVGGPHGNGTVFELSPKVHGWTERLLNDFPTGEAAAGPRDRLLMDGAGNLYGTGGSVFELSRTGNGWKFTNLHEFPSYQGDGANPYAGLIMDAAGNLYGTTDSGGAYKAGTVYELTPGSGLDWTEEILYSFGSFKDDGAVPSLGALAMDASGNLYGATDQGGKNTCYSGCGTIFRLRRGTDGRWKETVLYNFSSGSNGFGPGGGVVLDKAGNLYGTTVYGGSGCDCGVVYKLAPQRQGKWKYTVLHTFVGSDGAQPDANLILDDKGNLYGTTATGGPGGAGVAFQITP